MVARQSGTEERALRRLGVRVLLGSVLGLLAAFLFQIFGVIGMGVVGAEDEGSALGLAIFECAGALGAVIVMIALGGRSWVSTSREDMATTWRFSWGVLVASILFGIAGCVISLVDGEPITSDWYLTAPLVTLGCLGIGVMEEFMFRGIVFNGLLAVMGGTHRGLMAAIALVSVLFGVAHLDFTLDFNEPIMWVQAILKVVQTGMYSVILCTVVLRTRRLGGVSLFHGLDDLCVMLPAAALFGESLEAEYVSSGDDAIYSVVFYLVVCVMYLPFVVKSLRALKRDGDVYRGVFFEHALERMQRRQERRQGRTRDGRHGELPVPPQTSAQEGDPRDPSAADW